MPLLYPLNYCFAHKGFLLAQPISNFLTLCVSLYILNMLLHRERKRRP